MEASIRAECNAPELPPDERLGCRGEMFGRFHRELAAADGAIAAARRRGATAAELTPLNEECFGALRRRLVIDAADPDEVAELHDVLMAATEPAARAPDDPAIDDEMLPESARRLMDRRLDTTRADGSSDEAAVWR